ILDSSTPRRKWLGLVKVRREFQAHIVTMENRFDGSSVLIRVFGINNFELMNNLAVALRHKLSGREVKVQLVRETSKKEVFLSDFSM
ncbi:MAG: hypothetical protein OK457_07820, partial [Thaumarchaeota archaeon]|nr:hypothetical protein [Nitrososphaerota archaeon]